MEARRLLKKFRPDWVLAMGGSLSVPAVINARMLGIRILLQEQNVFPGLANRLLTRWADSVAVSFQESLGYLKGKNIWVSGLPIRPEIGQIAQAEGRKRLGLALDEPTYLIFGGSLGATRLNSLAVEMDIVGVVFGMATHRGVEVVAGDISPYCYFRGNGVTSSDPLV